MSDARAALLENSFFTDAKLSADAADAIRQGLIERRYPAGAQIFQEGSHAGEMFFVASGKVGIFKRAGDSHVLLAEIGPGGYFGELALVDGGDRSADAQALADTEVLALDEAHFDDLIERVPRLALSFLKATSKRLRAVSQAVADQDAKAAAPAGAGDPVVDRYPFPIASVYRSFSVIADPRPRLERFFDLLEVTVRYLGTLAIAAHVADPRPNAVVDEALVQGLSKVSLGQWMGLMREVLSEHDGAVEKFALPELWSFRFTRPGRPTEMAKTLDRVLTFRNETRHGAGGAMTEREAKEALAEQEPLLRSVLDSLAFLAEMPLVWVERMEFKKGQFSYRYQRCMGSHPDFTSDTLASRAPYETGQVFVLRGGELLPLSPFLLLESCPVCTNRELFFLHGIAAASLDYAELSRGHHLAWEAGLEAVAEIRKDARERLRKAE